MPIWLIPIIYAAVSIACSLVLPRIENAYFAAYTVGTSVASAQAFLSAAASGTMALTGIVFAIAFVMVQFSAIAYSPRLVLWFARDQTLFHSLGIFVATFVYSLATLAWIDRGGSGRVPLFSTLLVGVLLIASVLLFSWMVQRISDLQITKVLQLVGDKGREVIREMFQGPDQGPAAKWTGRIRCADDAGLGPIVRTLAYSGEPRTIARFRIAGLVRQAEQAGGTIVMACAVGDTIMEGTTVLRLHEWGETKCPLPKNELMRCVHLGDGRTFEQDPKFPIRLLVDIAIKALSPAINDPTTAVQAIDQIEDLMRRLGRQHLDAGYVWDANGVLRLVFPMPTWEDYLVLAFDEIRQFGATSVQVMRRLRSALIGIADSMTLPERADAIERYIKHLDLAIKNSPLDSEDQVTARQEDRQGLGLSRKPAKPQASQSHD
jgi:uncharacterized membrane protein